MLGKCTTEGKSSTDNKTYNTFKYAYYGSHIKIYTAAAVKEQIFLCKNTS